MGFRFSLFRVLSYFNLFSCGLLLLLILMGMMMSPMMQPQMIFTLVLLATTLHHNYLCTQLQRSLEQREEVWGPRGPHLLTIMTVLSIIYAAMILLNGIIMASISPGTLQQIAKQNGMSSDQVAATALMGSMLKFAAVILSIHGLAVLVNSVLSIGYLRRWKMEKALRDQDHFLDEQ